MTATKFRVRRATLDDLASLKGLWESMRLPAEALEKRLTEFQLVEEDTGLIIGAIGVQIVRQHARLHSEGYTDFGVTDTVRPLLFDRIQALATNYGVFRLWMNERSPFWLQQGFKPASEEVLARLPEQWKDPEHPNWVSLQLKDEEAIQSLEKEFALFKQAEQLRTARTLKKARLLRTIITVIGFMIGFMLIGAAAYIYLKRRHGY